MRFLGIILDTCRSIIEVHNMEAGEELTWETHNVIFKRERNKNLLASLVNKV